MNFHVLIFCLFIGANIEFHLCNGKGTRDENFNLDNAWRWQQEVGALKSDLKYKKEDGQLINLSSGRSKPSGTNVNSKDVKFFLYTNRNPKSGQTLKINDDSSFKNSNYDATKRTIFLTHGWVSSSQSQSCTLIRDAYLDNHDVNVIVVDWNAIASNILYPQVAIKVPAVGRNVGEMMNYMSTNQGLELEKTILVGHSLGAHVVGIAGHSVGGKPKAIFGLDPAYPLFKFPREGGRISDKDANHVQIIHANAGLLGIPNAWGHASFYMNGGIFQNGCLDPVGICSHSRAYQYFAESINSNVQFYGSQCHSLTELAAGVCLGPEKCFMGGFLPDSTIEKGDIFIVPVNANPPFAVGEYLEGWRPLGTKHIR